MFRQRIPHGAYIVNRAIIHRFEVFYWRDGNNEVDFILRKKNSIVAVEIKSNAEKRTEGFNKFKQVFNPQTAFIVGNGGISAADFFSMENQKLF